MKNRSLLWQIWSLFLLVIATLLIVMLIVIRSSISDFIDEQVYETLQNREMFLSDDPSVIAMLKENPIEFDRRKQESRSVNELFFSRNGKLYYGGAPEQLVDRMYQQAIEQDETVAKYTTRLGEEDVYYIIRKIEQQDETYYQVSYVWDAYRKQLISKLFYQVGWLVAAVSVGTLFAAFWLSRRLTKPLVEIEGAVGKIAARQWDTPLPLERGDEIGQLARSIDAMRSELAKQDKAQKSLLQNISHDLKTPIMVIRSYAQSISDGLYPSGDLTGSVSVIDEEAARLEKKVADLLYVTKLDYFEGDRSKWATVDLDRLIRMLVERFKTAKNIEWKVEGEAGLVNGEGEQLRVAIENVLDNAIRYAEGNIWIRLAKTKDSSIIKIENDGPPLDESSPLFHQFSRGKEGKFGLGLYIVKRIVEMHGGKVKIENLDVGNNKKNVCVEFEIPRDAGI
ncbi:sensor histidine kinase [Exiguobacterium flavidum]|uniref:sensor histidine kinase n=1 Tax=Exiguobacterium flavidum TaxID=2184695 RepID=UPI000DF86363|nr:HAMP domain-containing sensor histidine kinase [Exiguobacterium flavidum]